MKRPVAGPGERLVVVEVPVLPVSFNETRYAPWPVVHRKAKPLKEALILKLNLALLPRPRPGDPPLIESIEASAVLRFKDRRRRDEGNFRTPLEKTLGDVLTGRGYLADDTPDHYRFTSCEFAADTGSPLTIITLKWKATE